jgi:prepilin-type N-terminal cleavage/methylation domain-containing protein
MVSVVKKMKTTIPASAGMTRGQPRGIAPTNNEQRTMNNELKKNGVTLVELLVAIAIIALLVAAAIPSARALRSSYESTGAEAMISSAFASARAIAAKEHNYAGVRFQKAWQADNDGPQYMIFIVSEDPANMSGLTIGYRAVEGLKPIKLPTNMIVMDLKYGAGGTTTYDISGWANLNSDWNTGILSSAEFCDTTTFSVIFSPTGKLIIQDVRVRNKNGVTNNTSYDETFNVESNVTAANPIGMFIQDDYTYPTSFTVAGSTFGVGLHKEQSRSSFVICDKEKLKNAKSNTGAVDRWFSYLKNLPVVHINQYTGTMIEK